MKNCIIPGYVSVCREFDCWIIEKKIVRLIYFSHSESSWGDVKSMDGLKAKSCFKSKISASDFYCAILMCILTLLAGKNTYNFDDIMMITFSAVAAECHYDFCAKVDARVMKSLWKIDHFLFVSAAVYWILWILYWRFVISDGAEEYFLTRFRTFWRWHFSYHLAFVFGEMKCINIEFSLFFHYCFGLEMIGGLITPSVLESPDSSWEEFVRSRVWS